MSTRPVDTREQPVQPYSGTLSRVHRRDDRKRTSSMDIPKETKDREYEEHSIRSQRDERSPFEEGSPVDHPMQGGSEVEQDEVEDFDKHYSRSNGEGKLLESHREQHEDQDDHRGNSRGWSMIPQIFRGRSGDSSDQAAKLRQQNEELHRKLERAQKKLSIKTDELQKAYEGSQKLYRRVQEQEHEIAQLSHENSKIKRAKNAMKEELMQAKKDIMENEAIVTKAHTHLVSMLASDVSSDFPDDMVRAELQGFFQGEFFSWCADLCVQDIPEPEKVAGFLGAYALINDSKFYDDAPEQFKFDIRQPDGVASLALLQSALSTILCQVYLIDPFFLANGIPELEMCDRCWTRPGTRALERVFADAQTDAAIDWRIQTVKMLELTMPLTRDSAKTPAMSFLNEFGWLLNGDETAEEDLISLFERFACLALKMWKLRTTIHVLSMPHFTNERFQWDSEKMTAEGDAAELGRRLNGRPISLLTRPLIISRPVVGQGQHQEDVVWMKAGAWVSNQQRETETN